MVRKFNIGYWLSAFTAYTGVAALLLSGLTKTETELSAQTNYFISSVSWLVSAAFLTLIFSKRQFRFTVIDLIVVLFFVYCSFNYLYLSPVDASTKYLNLIYLLLLYGSIRVVLPVYKGLAAFAFVVVMLCGLWEAFLGLKQAWGFSRSNHSLFPITGTFFNPGPYGGYIAVVMSLAFSYMVHRSFLLRPTTTKRRLPWLILYRLCCTVFALSFVIFFAVMSRAAFVALFVCAAIIVYRKREWRERMVSYMKNNRLRIITATVTIAVAIPLMLVSLYRTKPESADGRFLIWRISTRIIEENLFFGVGYGAFGGEYAKSQAAYFQQHTDSPLKAVAGVPEYGFNEYLKLGAETGATGLILFLAMILTAIYRMIKTRNRFLYGLVAVAVFAFFSYPFSVLPLQVFTVLFVVSGAVSKTRGTVKQDILSKLISVFCAGIALLICLMLNNVFKDKVSACREWKKSRYLYEAKLYEQASKEYAALYPVIKDNPRFLFEYGQSLCKTEQHNKSNIVLTEGVQLSSDPMFHNIIGNNYMAVSKYDLAEKSYRQAHAILPNRLYPLWLLMILYQQTGKAECAEKVAKEIIEFIPKVESSATNEMKRDAEKLLQKNYNIDPSLITN